MNTFPQIDKLNTTFIIVNNIVTGLKNQISTHKYILLILLLGALLRFYDFPNRYSISGDSARDAMVAFESASRLQLPLTGPFSSLGSFTFGPWYFWIISMGALVLRFAFAPWLLITLSSIFTVYLMYKIGTQVFNQKTGLTLAFITAISPFQNITSTGLTNPNITAFFSALSIYLFLRSFRSKNPKTLPFFFGLILGISVTIHYSVAGLLPLAPALLLRSNQKISSFIKSIGGILAAFTPTLLFELNNNWFNLKNIIYYYQVGQYNIYVPNRWLFYIRDFWPGFLAEFFGLHIYIAVPLTLAIIAISLYLIYRKKFSLTLLILTIILAINFLILRYYRGERSYGYLQYLYPLLITFLGIFINYILTQFKSKYTIIALISAFFLVTFINTAPKFERSYKNATIIEMSNAIIENFPSEKFMLYQCESYSYDNIYGMTLYLEKLNKIDPNGRKIGLLDQHCFFPLDSPTPVSVKELQDPLFVSPYPMLKKIHAADFSQAPETKLTEYKWNPLSQDIVFVDVTRWWLK